MPVPGYDLEDVDEMLESKLSEAKIRDHLSESEWQSYQDGEESLIDLLGDDEIDGILGK